MFQSSYLEPWFKHFKLVIKQVTVTNPTKEEVNFPSSLTNVNRGACFYENNSFQGSEFGHRDRKSEPFGM